MLAKAPGERRARVVGDGAVVSRELAYHDRAIQLQRFGTRGEKVVRAVGPHPVVVMNLIVIET